METRRSFCVKGAAAVAALSLGPAGCSHYATQEAAKPLRTKDPRKAAVLWYSQTGHTERYGRLIARRLELAGLTVSSGDMRRFDIAALPGCDLVVVGSAVQYYDAPSNVRQWLDGLPVLDGIAAAAYVSFGGPEGNQHNAGCSILERLTKKGGVPVGLDAFMNIGTFPFPDWKGPGIEGHMHLPDEATYERVRAFSAAVLDRIRKVQAITFSRNVTLREFAAALPIARLSKSRIAKHAINRSICIRCGTCAAVCPVKAIDIDAAAIDRDRCIACFGCLNNCPTEAMEMEMSGTKLYGFNKFKARKGIVTAEPAELRDKPAESAAPRTPGTPETEKK